MQQLSGRNFTIFDNISGTYIFKLAARFLEN